MTPKEIGNIISNEIVKKGITQRELSAQIGISESTLCRYVKGERMPKLDIICKIADALETSVDALVGRPSVYAGDNNLGAIFNSAVRYALGRQSYMPSLVTNYISHLLPSIDDVTLYALGRDLERYKEDVEQGLVSWGMDCDKETWLSFYDKVVEEREKRKK